MVLALVLGVHLLFLWAASWRGRLAPSGPEPEAMILLDLTPRPVEVPKTPPKTPQRPAPRTLARTSTPQSPQPAEAPQAPAAITPQPPHIDWQAEAHITAEAQAKDGVRQQRQECEEAALKHNPLPPGCPKDSYDPHWSPQEKKAGFIGVIPYFRLGKRCIVVPPFFACNMDAKLPDPRGDLLNDMNDPSRPASSVPELDNAAPLAPSPQALKPQ